MTFKQRILNKKSLRDNNCNRHEDYNNKNNSNNNNKNNNKHFDASAVMPKIRAINSSIHDKIKSSTHNDISKSNNNNDQNNDKHSEIQSVKSKNTDNNKNKNYRNNNHKNNIHNTITSTKNLAESKETSKTEENFKKSTKATVAATSLTSTSATAAQPPTKAKITTTISATATTTVNSTQVNKSNNNNTLAAFLFKQKFFGLQQKATQFWIFSLLFIVCLTFDGSQLAAAQTNEAYFNGSAYLRLLTPMPIWDHSAISFRSCRGGEILAQQYNKNSIVISVLNDFLQISLAGPAVSGPSNRLDVKYSFKLLDNRWHTLQFKYEFGNLFLYVDRTSTLFANATYNSQFLTIQDIGNEAAILILGNSFSGCLLSGPGLQFINGSMTVQNVVFGDCPLSTGECGDHDVFIKDQSNFCSNDPCMGHGLCISHADSYECRCTPRYSGKNCQKDNGSPCARNPCINATCNEDSRGDYQCICPPNHTGRHCETEVNLHPLCQNNPCHNNGACVVSPGSATIECDCPKGFAGTRCEINIDDCASQPCLNNGRCTDQVNGFVCDCLGTGFNGPLCQININECEMSPCQNGGQCFDTYGWYICQCPNGWAGEVCEKPIGCQTQKCLNGGTCVAEASGFQCICPPGYSGELCQQAPMLPCPQCPDDAECVAGKCKCKPGHNCDLSQYADGSPTSIPLTALSCHNGGRCLNGGTCSMNGTHCYCPTGYSGDRCERLDPCDASNCRDPMVCVQNKCICPENKVCAVCASQPCRNGGVCAELGNGEYECKCSSGWKGRNCHVDVDECTDQPNICGNGICKNEEGSYKCYCTPGFTGVHCDSDVDECLSHPCVNGATCHNKINAYECVCPKGYTGLNCEIDINECESNPCLQGSTCIDMVNNFTCSCIPGMTGRLCDENIDDCISAPCLNGGQCVDELNGFHCECIGTGYEGLVCELNIDECAANLCTNGAECIDQVNDYMCKCHPGYKGKNCEIDINECESNPCQYNGTCLERSNITLYKLSETTPLPDIFSRPFSYENASGYECVCVPGIVGKNCEININECESNPCSKHGTCNDGVGTYTCECDPGFEGQHCEANIDECDRYKPCLNGTCIDLINDYECDCDANFGGKNCSVPLVGCLNAPCKNDGTCKPYLVNETEHLFNCSCQHGFQGATCEKTTTISMVERSLITVRTRRDEGYDINLQFKTTIPNGVLAFGTSIGQNEPVSYILELINGRLNLHSSLLNKWEGVFIGSKLNDSKWHKVFVAINTSHLVLSANDEQAIFPVGSYETANGSQGAFPLTYLGGTIPNLKSYLRHLTHQPSSFVGCMQDIVVNGKWIFPDEQGFDVDTTLTNIRSGCPRTEQCNPNPCHSNGECTDLWYKFLCTCLRPHFGHTCEYNITAATFGHENTTHSAVLVEATDFAKRAIRSVLDISMFIRTRKPKGYIFYLGSDPKKSALKSMGDPGDSYVAAKLQGGELLVKMQFNGTPEAYTVGGNKLDNGYNHLIEVVRNQTLVRFLVNGTEFFRKTLSTTGVLDAQVLYLGGPPPTIEPTTVTEPGIPGPVDESTGSAKDDEDKEYFKGIIQDVKISNGTQTFIVELYPLNEEKVTLPPQFGDVTIDRTSVLKGEVTDDLCRKNPCKHNAECRNTWNDYVCFCPNGYKGKNCQEIEFCQLYTSCPGKSVCQNLDDGYECLTNVTFKGNEKAPLAFSFYAVQQHPPSEQMEESHVLLRPVIELAYRTRAGGTLLYIENHESFFEIGVNQGQVTVTWKLGADQFGETKRFTKDNSDLEWSQIYLRAKNGKLEGGWKGWESAVDGLPSFTADIDQVAFQSLISGGNQVYLGGMPDNRLTRGTTSSQQGSQFKGCLGEARVGELLLPYFHSEEIYPQIENMSVQPQYQFRLNATKPEEGCVLCFGADCENGGYCSDPHEQYACTCLAGYDGDDCSIDIDECLTVTCENNATCIDKVADFECSCLPGYEGKLCETNIDECAPQPCHNGGNCTDLIAAFHCDCPEEYAGPVCDVLKQVTCENLPCKNGSTCEDVPTMTNGNNFTCHCMENFEGPLCDVPFCETTDGQCKNGLCITSDPMNPVCQCSLGFTGKFCETNIDECQSNPCQNGGTCEDKIGAYACHCASGFEGTNCETDIDECAMSVEYCGGLGRCINLPGSFKCICQDSYCGAYCNFTDPCKQEAELCMNGGLCVEACGQEADYYCNCTNGYTGKNCTALLAAKDGSPSTTDIAIIVVPIVVVLLLVALGLLATFLIMAKNKRATRGTYSPSAQEYCNPRLEMDNVLKPPPEERLI